MLAALLSFQIELNCHRMTLKFPDIQLDRRLLEKILKLSELLGPILYRIGDKRVRTTRNDGSNSDIAWRVLYHLPEYKREGKDRAHKQFHRYFSHMSVGENSKMTRQDKSARDCFE